ncbi:MAG: hypothetical protein AB8D52_03770 [Gammaproteobacteria bacterium]
MKTKVTEWGNSHGIRMTSVMMEHLNIQTGEEIEMDLTNKGIEIIKSKRSVGYLKTVSKEIHETVLAQTNPVQIVDDPYLESEVAYIVVDINSCAPLIREVPPGTKNSFATLADAKEAARQLLQASIAEAQQSLSDLRQLGIDNISYIS